MDKMLQLCQIFNLNIDDLLNQDIKEVNNKQAKNNVNKFIDDFLDYVTKTIDMFSGMKFKEKVKCLFEQFILIFVIGIVLLIIGLIGSSIFSNLISFIPNSIYYSLHALFEALYFGACLVLGAVLLLHIFKVRYLDYYIIVKNEVSNVETNEQKNDEMKDANESKKILLEKKKEKIVIRDPEHSGYKFISGMLRILLFIIKGIVSFVAIILCLPLILLMMSLIISFLFVKTGILFIGAFLLILSLIIINIIILVVLYNLIISKKNQEKKMFLSFIVSLLISGIGIGVIMIGLTNFDIIDDINAEYYISQEQIIEMTDILFFQTYYGEIEYVESDNSDIRLVHKYSDIYDINMNKFGDGYYLYLNLPNRNIMSAVRRNVEDINNKQIINYSNYRLYIYTNKENIQTLKNNLSDHYRKQDENEMQEIINYYENTIDELSEQIDIKNNIINELEEDCNVY